MSPAKKLKRWLVYMLARFLIGAWNLLPFPLALAIGKGLGRTAYYFARGPRERAQSQMKLALSITQAETQKLTKSLFTHCGMLAVELAMLEKLQVRLNDYVQLSSTDQEKIHAALQEEKGVIIVSAHLGNWELLAQRMVSAGFTSSTLARLNPNPYLGRWIVKQRARFGLNVIDRSEPQAARRVFAALKQNQLVGFLIDQDTRVQSMHVPFFGRPASTPIGAAQFALRKGIPVFTAFMSRENQGHRIKLRRIPLENFHSQPKEEAILGLTAEMTADIEEAVREHPAQWMWFHERWKTPILLSDAQEGKQMEQS